MKSKYILYLSIILNLALTWEIKTIEDVFAAWRPFKKQLPMLQEVVLNNTSYITKEDEEEN